MSFPRALPRTILRSLRLQRPPSHLRCTSATAIAPSTFSARSLRTTCLVSAISLSAFTSASRAFADNALPIAPSPSLSPSAPDIVLYQYEVCPFCCKVRAYMDYHNIPYRVVEVDPLRKTELKQFSDAYRKVPIALIDGQQVNGSRQVIERLRDVTQIEQPTDALQHKWLTWLDDRFIHLIAPNIYRSARESLQTFEYISEKGKFSPWQRSSIKYSGAMAMFFVGRKLKSKYEIGDEREEILRAMAEWTEAIEEGGGKFLGGSDTPGMADLSVYGVLKAIQTFDTFRDIRSHNQRLGEWFDSTKEAIGDAAIIGAD